MATAGGANIAVDGLVFGYDTGYPLVSGNSDTYKFNKGEPTENLVGNPTFIGTSGTQTQGVTPANWIFSGEPGPNGFLFYDSGSSPIPLKFQNEGSVITINSGSQNRRIYFRRTDLLPNTTYTISCWMYFSGSFTNSWSKFQYDSTGSSLGIGYFDSFSNYASANGHSLEEWFLWEGTLTTEPTTAQCYWGPVISDGPKNLVGLQRMKVEVKDHRTPFVNGTRSVSGSLIDLTRTTDIDLSNVSFDSNAQMTFDGTDDIVNINFPTLSSDSGSIEVVVSREGTTSNSFVFAKVGDSTNRYYLRQPSSDTLDAVRGNPLSYASFGTLTLGKYYHLVMTWDSSTVYAYKNGVLQNTNSYTNPNTDISDAQIGDGPGNNIAMKLPILKIHNKTLSAQEILQNYNAVKERFSL